MMDFFRSLFGLGGASGKRIALGHPVDVDVRDVKYIRESKSRLATLHLLYNRYKKTPHGPKIKAVYDKTKTIQNYLIARNRVHELELFHIRNTEHFINAFTVILNAHQQAHEIPDSSEEPSESGSKADSFFKVYGLEKRKEQVSRKAEMSQSINNSQRTVVQTAEVAEAGVPTVSVPAISINTFEKVPYFPEGLAARAIGYASTELEKEDFLRHLSFCLGIDKISYMGNATVHIAGSKQHSGAGLLPIIYWKGFLYAVNLNDNCRLFPVKTFRKGL